MTAPELWDISDKISFLSFCDAETFTSEALDCSVLISKPSTGTDTDLALTLTSILSGDSLFIGNTTVLFESTFIPIA